MVGFIPKSELKYNQETILQYDRNYVCKNDHNYNRYLWSFFL